MAMLNKHKYEQIRNYQNNYLKIFKTFLELILLKLWAISHWAKKKSLRGKRNSPNSFFSWEIWIFLLLKKKNYDQIQLDKFETTRINYP